jgi:hypothetical protein
LATGRVTPPRSVEAESRPRRDADAIMWDHAEHHRAGGEARAVDDHILAGIPQRLEFIEVGTDLPARIGPNAHAG